MSEYWKSTPKYWCKHCSIYVKDTTLERKQHENTGKHQGNLKRFLQGIQKDHLKNEREKDKAKAEVDRLNRVVGSMPSSATSSSSSTRLLPSGTSSSSNSLSAADQKRQWAQLAEMGIVVPDSARAEMAMAGDWQTISRRVESEPSVEDTTSTERALNIGVKKRKLGDDEEELETEDNKNIIIRKGWGSATRSYPGQPSPDLDSLLAIPLKGKFNTKPASNSTMISKLEGEDLDAKRTDENFESMDTLLSAKSDLYLEKRTQEIGNADQQDDVRIKNESENVRTLPTDSGKDQEIAVPLFKKRKAKANQS